MIKQAKDMTDAELNIEIYKKIFAMDEGGNERTQLYLMNDDGSDIKSITNDPDNIYRLGGVSKDGKKIVYASNKRDKQFFDIYVMDLESLDHLILR